MKDHLTTGSGGGAFPKAYPGGVYWDESRNAVWWSYGEGYVPTEHDPSIGATILDDSTGTFNLSVSSKGRNPSLRAERSEANSHRAEGLISPITVIGEIGGAWRDEAFSALEFPAIAGSSDPGRMAPPMQWEDPLPEFPSGKPKEILMQSRLVSIVILASVFAIAGCSSSDTTTEEGVGRTTADLDKVAGPPAQCWTGSAKDGTLAEVPCPTGPKVVGPPEPCWTGSAKDSSLVEVPCPTGPKVVGPPEPCWSGSAKEGNLVEIPCPTK